MTLLPYEFVFLKEGVPLEQTVSPGSRLSWQVIEPCELNCWTMSIYERFRRWSLSAAIQRHA